MSAITLAVVIHLPKAQTHSLVGVLEVGHWHSHQTRKGFPLLCGFIEVMEVGFVNIPDVLVYKLRDGVLNLKLGQC